MKVRTFVSILILALSTLLISGCATTTKAQEEKEGVNQEVFIWSVRSGDYAEVKRLIEEGVDVNAKDYNEYTVLMSASYDGHREIAKLLIEEGADVNAQCKLGYTALIEASAKSKGGGSDRSTRIKTVIEKSDSDTEQLEKEITVDHSKQDAESAF